MTLRPVLPLVALTTVTLLLMLVWWLRGWRAKGVSARMSGALRVVLALLAVGIALRPVQGYYEPRPVESRSDLLIVIDRTTSMGATDYAGGPRMNGVVGDVSELMGQVAGARVSVIVIDDEAQLAVPFTTDAQAVVGFVRTLGWRNARTAAGSDISVGVPLARQTLEHAAEEHPDHLRYFVYCGDGEQTVNAAPGSFADLAELVSGSLVLGYGTTEGATMLLSPDSDRLVTVGGVAQVSRLDEPNLAAIAAQTQGQYLRRTGPGGLPELVPAEMRTEDQFVTATEYYWMLALAGVPLLVALLVQSVLGFHTARAELSPERRLRRKA